MKRLISVIGVIMAVGFFASCTPEVEEKIVYVEVPGETVTVEVPVEVPVEVEKIVEVEKVVEKEVEKIVYVTTDFNGNDSTVVVYKMNCIVCSNTIVDSEDRYFEELNTSERTGTIYMVFENITETVTYILSSGDFYRKWTLPINASFSNVRFAGSTIGKLGSVYFYLGGSIASGCYDKDDNLMTHGTIAIRDTEKPFSGISENDSWLSLILAENTIDTIDSILDFYGVKEASF